MLSSRDYDEAMAKIRDAGAKIISGYCGTSPAYLANGVKILGGCCGTNPAHIIEMVRKIR